MKSYKQMKKELLKGFLTTKFSDVHKPGLPLANKFIKARVFQGLTQVDLAKRLKTSQAAIARFESGKSNPTVQFLFNLASALGSKLIIRLN